MNRELGRRGEDPTLAPTNGSLRHSVKDLLSALDEDVWEEFYEDRKKEA